MREIIIPLILLGLGLALLHAAWGDIRARIIPNWLVGLIAAGAPLWWWANDLALWPDVAVQLGIALAVFAIFTAIWMLRAMGGGDVKLVTALALWLPLGPLVQMLTIMALAGGVITLIILAAHRYRKILGQPEIPYGVAISFAGIWVFTNHLLTISVT